MPLLPAFLRWLPARPRLQGRRTVLVAILIRW